MKHRLFSLPLALMLLAAGFLSSCVSDSCKIEIKYKQYTPVYMSEDAFLNAVKLEAPAQLQRTGKIYTFKGYLFVNELAKGIHIYDNRNTANPVPVAFLNIPGNYDMAASDDHLYCDSGTDLLAFDLSNPRQPVLESRSRNAFPKMLSYNGYTADPAMGVVVDWKEEIITQKLDDCRQPIPALWKMNEVKDNNSTVGAVSDINAQRTVHAAPAGTNKGGSMARFAVVGNFLYVVMPTDLMVYNLSGGNASLTNTIKINSITEAQTIFPHNDLLLIGSNDGMVVFNNANPSQPQQIGNIAHVSSCDPVVANQKHAFVSLNSDADNSCGGFSNQIEVIDIQKPSQPERLSIYPMAMPKGIGVDGDILFVTDGRDGLRVYNAADPMTISSHQIAAFPNTKGYDVIPDNGNLIFVSREGIAQYDYKDLNNIRLVSKIPVVK